VIRTRAGYLESIRDGRQVVWAGRMVADITNHAEMRAFAEAIATRYELDEPERSALDDWSEAGSVLDGALAPAALRIVCEDGDGIVVCGWAGVVPTAPFAHTFAARVRRETEEGPPLTVLVPAAHPRVTHFVSPSHDGSLANGSGTPAYPGSELTVVVYFEEVRIPWVRVYVSDGDTSALVEADLL
jgi:aromatic ring hydroxylase